jgi:nucleoside-diphosphate-sugar epimerase
MAPNQAQWCRSARRDKQPIEPSAKQSEWKRHISGAINRTFRPGLTLGSSRGGVYRARAARAARLTVEMMLKVRTENGVRVNADSVIARTLSLLVLRDRSNSLAPGSQAAAGGLAQPILNRRCTGDRSRTSLDCAQLTFTQAGIERSVKVLLTGHRGYIGSVLAPLLLQDGHEVIGLDSDLFDGCDFGALTPVPGLRLDLRDVQSDHLVGFDAVLHLAALSNDPLSNLDPGLTYEINHRAAVRLARLAKQAGVPRYIFSSSCSLYGAAGDDFLDESAAFNPVTAYGESKVFVERDVRLLADDSFSPTFLRNATAYGVSPRLRGDLVVNNLVGYAYTTGNVLIKSDGSPWRPLVHIRDIAAAFIAVLRAPREVVHNESFNVGRTAENYRIREVADMVREVVPGSTVIYAADGGPDLRCYRVDCEKIARVLPEFRPSWTVRRGVEELYEAYRSADLQLSDLDGPRYVRLAQILRLRAEDRLDASLRYKDEPVLAPV